MNKVDMERFGRLNDEPLQSRRLQVSSGLSPPRIGGETKRHFRGG